MARFVAPPIRIDVEVAGMKLSEDFAELARIDPDAMLAEVTEHPATFAYSAVLLAAARKQRDAVSRRLKREKGALYLDVRARKADQKLTEAMIDAEIASNASIVEWEQQLADAEEVCDQLQALCDAFRQRKDLLVMAASILRASGEDVR